MFDQEVLSASEVTLKIDELQGPQDLTTLRAEQGPKHSLRINKKNRSATSVATYSVCPSATRIPNGG